MLDTICQYTLYFNIDGNHKFIEWKVNKQYVLTCVTDIKQENIRKPPTTAAFWTQVDINYHRYYK